LSEKRWNLAFDDVRGRAEYGHGGFDADKLAVMRAGQPGKLSLRAGDYTRDPKQAFEAELDAMLSAKDLLDRAPELDWLKPRVEGRSSWTIAVSIPKSANAKVVAPTRLQLRSSLVGTALTLPAPLDKPAGVALETTVDTNLPFDQGEIAVAFGNRLALRARSRNGQTGLRVELGSRQVDEAPPASGLIATGRTTTLDAIDWAALTRGGGDGGGSGLSLRRVDVTAARLRLLGTDFPDTRVRATPSAAGTALQFDGDALAGAVLLPQADSAAIAGRLQRMYWQLGKPAAAAAPTAGDDDVDPAKVPPLNLVVDDLRFGDAHLGAASLRTRPLANGMRIEQLQSRAPKQRIDVSGEWLGHGSAARTRLAMVIDSDDFGGLLAGFGYGGQLSGGEGTARFEASWPGSPAGFSLGTLDGTLKLSARDGQLTEVEPGAGRVLGLLSLAQLPRRLTLDFRDFFSKGFAFNKLDGDVRLDSGTARTDALVIDGPAAEIHISGAADLRAQTFNQTIEVLPKAGNLLTAVGAIAGGPIGAAIGAAANAVLKKPLGQLGAKTYRVTGPWKEPKVEVIGREQSRISVARDPAPAG
jgi:uncharacterized protein (TIGR02099 family)